MMDAPRIAMIGLLGALPIWAAMPNARPVAPYEHATVQLGKATSKRPGLQPHGVELIRAALNFSGVSEPTAQEPYLGRFLEYRRQLERDLAECHTREEKARAIHVFMHARILKEYRATGSDLARLFDDGIYNCLTATVLFVGLAESLGLEAGALQSPGHVAAVVPNSSAPVFVECAAPHWFGSDQASRIAELVRDSRPVDASQLVAIFHYNRGVECLQNRDFSRAMGATLAALRLDPHNTYGRDNLLATLNNWAVALADQGNFEPALTLLSAGEQFAPEYQPFRANRRYVEYRRYRAGRTTSHHRSAN